MGKEATLFPRRTNEVQEYATMEFSTSEMRIVAVPTVAAGSDVLSDILRQGAQRLLSQAIESEVAE